MIQVCHCERREATQGCAVASGLLRVARNDGKALRQLTAKFAVVACALIVGRASASVVVAQEAPAQTTSLAPAPPPDEEALRRRCDNALPRKTALTDAEAATCRQLFLDGIAAARVRQQAYQQAAIDAFKARKTRQKVEGPVPISSFVGEDTLVFGDIVMSDAGPRVYIGRPNEPARLEDLVTLDSARSPHRKKAKEMLRQLQQ